MNELDGKVIVDRDVFVGILDMARRGLDSGFFGDVFHKDFAKGEQALATDLTGWAAVPVEPPHRMQIYGEIELPPNHRGYGLEKDVFFAMLEASPPLPGGGE